MILKFDDFYLTEKIEIKDKPKEITILFMDLVKSSKKWTKNEKEMLTVLKDISILFDKFVNEYNGLIIKSIGDAYMIKFNNLVDSIEFSIFIQEYLNNNPIKVNNEKIIFRIGICQGEVYEITQDIQNFKLVDYLGNTVNTASRIESKVCDDGGVAFATTLNKKYKIDKKIDKILKPYKVELITFSNKGEEHKRSYRILTDIQKHTFKHIDELKDIDNISVYKVKI